MPEDINRHAIQVLLNDTEANHPRYVTRAGGIHLEGELSTHVEDAKTWATQRGAEEWMRRRGAGEHGWRERRQSAGQTVTIVPVRMHPKMKTVPSRLAGPAPGSRELPTRAPAEHPR